MTCRVEPVSHGAAEPVSMLHRACFPDDPWDMRAIQQIMGIPGFFGRVAWQEEAPVGFALALDLGGESEIVSLGVVCDRRRAGIGLTLLRSVCREARLRNAEGVVLEVAVDNHAARVLYAAAAFTAVGHRPNYYRRAGRFVDGLILRRALATGSPST
jgi:[ribosomal protein S18]-alanine N-acetyltransferase